MPEPILKITAHRLTTMLRRAYELGCVGWMELSEGVAEELLQECIADLRGKTDPAEREWPDDLTRFNDITDAPPDTTL